MMLRQSYAFVVAAALLAAGCGGGQNAAVQQDQPAGAADTLPPARIVPGAAGSSPAPAGQLPDSVTAPAPAASAQSTAGPVIVDVRTQQEYDAGHVQGAILIPYDQMAQRWQELKQYQDQPVVLYCRSGRRSGIALDVLRSKGFTGLENGGGIDAMAAHGYQIVKD